MLPLIVLGYLVYWAYLYIKRRYFPGDAGGDAAAPAAPPPRPALKVWEGKTVAITGLGRRADLNTAWGVVKGLDKEGGPNAEKAPVHLRDGRRVLIKRTNLVDAKETPLAMRIALASKRYGNKVRIVPAVPSRHATNIPPSDLPVIVASVAIHAGEPLFDDVVLVAQTPEDIDAVGACARNDNARPSIAIYGDYTPDHTHLKAHEENRPHYYNEPRLYERDAEAVEKRRRNARYTNGLHPPQLTEKELATIPAKQRQFYLNVLQHLPVQGVWCRQTAASHGAPVLTSFTACLPSPDQINLLRKSGRGVRFTNTSAFANCAFRPRATTGTFRKGGGHALANDADAACAPFGGPGLTLHTLRDIEAGEVLTVYRGNPNYIEAPLARPVLITPKQQPSADAAGAPPTWVAPVVPFAEPTRDVMLMKCSAKGCCEGGVPQMHVDGACQGCGGANPEHNRAEVEWLSVMVRDHIDRPARYSHTHFAALLNICAGKLGVLHWTVAALACGILEILSSGVSKDTKLSKKGLVRVALIVRYLGLWDAYYRAPDETPAHGVPVLLASRAAARKVFQIFEAQLLPTAASEDPPAAAAAPHSKDRDATFDTLTPEFTEWLRVFQNRPDQDPRCVMTRLVPPAIIGDWPEDAVASHDRALRDREDAGGVDDGADMEWWHGSLDALFGDRGGAEAMRVHGAEKKLLHAMKTKADPLSNPYSSHQQSMDGYVDDMLHTLGHDRGMDGEHDQQAYMTLLSKLHHGDDFEERQREAAKQMALAEERQRQARMAGEAVPADDAPPPVI